MWLSLDGIQRLELQMEDLILVTGRDLAKSWLVAAFTDDQSKGNVQIGIQPPAGLGTISIGASVSWQNARSAEYNWGPDETIIITDPLPGRSQSYAELPGRDQCISLRGFRVKRRRFPFTKLKIEGAAEPEDFKLHEHDHDDSPQASSCPRSELSPGVDNVEIEYISCMRKVNACGCRILRL
jgi:hypothetical protein